MRDNGIPTKEGSKPMESTESIDPQNMSPEQQRQFEAKLKSMSWRTLTTLLMQSVEQHHRPVELPAAIRRWLELNRAARDAAAQGQHARREAEEVRTLMEMSEEAGWGNAATETLPISGWIIGACHFLRDGERWWLFTAQRHDDAAPLAGIITPAAANQLDLKKLGKIIAYAGGNPARELLRTGAITQKEHDELLAEGRPDVAAYGQIFFWWRAR